ncbi:MAG: GH32 C-terminal domain-containing protein [Opitutaceae bacterium]|jgi:sucrose-6-phosphate hydrolase SacC (GH32 family)|nr:GH32 C-terminal domain-containing protein [Opitutaceae bacterium]
MSPIRPILAALALATAALALAARATAASAAAPAPRDILASAFAVWHMDAANRPAAASPAVNGRVALGRPLAAADRAASLARGGDGLAARFDGGHLDAGPAFQPRGDQLTLLLRVKPDAARLPNGELFCKRQGHDKTTFNLYSNTGALGFEFCTENAPRLAASIRAPADALAAGAWHDIIARYDGRRVTLFINGLAAASAPVAGRLAENTQPILIGKNLRGEIDHAALWSRALSDGEIAALSGGASAVAAAVADPARRAKIEAVTGKDGLTTVDQLRAARDLRAKLAADPHRPRYHLMPPDGFWNDINGTLFHKGRYHVMFLGRQAPDAATVLAGADNDRPREIWLHASSADLVHWIHHPPAVAPVFDGTMPRGIYSGDAINDAPTPTLIYHVPNLGTCISTAADPDDPELIKWTPHPKNPVIPYNNQPPEVRVFDPCAWREPDGTYYALVGNTNKTPGYEGDSSSLYKSRDLINWEYRGPFYKSDRKWTPEYSDAACPDFFPIGNGRHMLVMHCHRPQNKLHYYIGVWDRAAEKFLPERHGWMSWPGGSICAPETLLDGKGRRVFWGWVYGHRTSDAWASLASLPRILSLFPDNTLRIQPAPELEILRHDERAFDNIKVNGSAPLAGVAGDTLEIRAKILPGKTGKFGLIVRQTPDGAEQLPIWIDLDRQTLSTDMSKSTLDPKIRYATASASRPEWKKLTEAGRYTTSQTAPLEGIAKGEPVDLRVFIDKSIVEIFVNDRQCLTQRVYPTRPDAKNITLTANGAVTFEKLQVWNMHPTQ